MVTKFNTILIVQKKAIRVMTKTKKFDHCKPLLYIFDRVSYIFNRSKSLILVSDCHKHNIRNKSNISFEHCRLTKTQQSHIIASQKRYNKGKHLIGKYPKKSFFTMFYNWFILNPF